MKYGSYDLGYGIHISPSVEEYEPIMPNAFVASHSLLKLNPPTVFGLRGGDYEEEWDRQWAITKKVAHHIVDLLNNGLNPEQVKDPRFVDRLYEQFSK